MALAHARPPAQGAVVPVPQAPLAQTPAVVSCPAEQPGAEHWVPDATCSQAPPAAHLPVLPQVAAVHWPAGAETPALMGPQVPSAPAVSAAVQAWQVPLQGLLQQMPLTQCALPQSPSAAQLPPLGFDWQVLALGSQ